MKRAVVFITAAFFFNTGTYSQDALNSFRKLSFSEKRWVMFHPFVARKAQTISIESKEVVESMKKDPRLDKYDSGGRADAFRHGYWMARLTQEIGWRKAYRLGIAHEKGNYRQFKKYDGSNSGVPDEPSSAMDFLNNDAGIEAGKRFPSASPEELSEIIITMITEGKMYVLSRDSLGNFLDCSGNIIDMTAYKGKWKNPKCVVTSSEKIQILDNN